MNEDAGASQIALDEFLHAAVHDIRGPLGQVRALAALLERQHKNSLDADGQELCKLLEAASQRAIEVVEALHVYTELLEPLVWETADLNAIVDSASYALQSSIETEGATITRDDLPSVTGDGARLLLLFQELFRNALKFRGDEAPTIHCSALDNPSYNSGQVLVSVSDNGIGISPVEAELVFKPLKRLHGQEHAGAGMGLTICRRIVEMHGGMLKVQSQPGAGASFVFSLTRC